MSCQAFFDSAYDYASTEIELPTGWSRSYSDICKLVEMKMPNEYSVFVMNDPVASRRYLIMPTGLGNVVISELQTATHTPYYVYLPQVVGAMIGVFSGAAITTAEEFRVFYDPLFKTTLRKKLRDIQKAFQDLELETTA